MALLALLMLPAAYFLGYPVAYVFDKFLVQPTNRLSLKKYEWDAAYRD